LEGIAFERREKLGEMHSGECCMTPCRWAVGPVDPQLRLYGATYVNVCHPKSFLFVRTQSMCLVCRDSLEKELGRILRYPGDGQHLMNPPFSFEALKANGHF
jgi:hypothetical protein